MIRTPITPSLAEIPAAFHAYLRGAAVYDSSCSRTAQVYFIDRDSGYYLKSAASGMLTREAEMGTYFHALGLGAEVLGMERDETRDWLLCRRVPGEDATHADHVSDPRWVSATLGETLRMLHETAPVGCPHGERLSEYLHHSEENFHTGRYDATHFPDSFGYRSADEAWAALTNGRELLCADTLIHGDYCLPNVLFCDKQFSGFIDLGQAGVSDRHIDLFWGIWSLGFNLHTDAYRDRFLDAYGRERVDEDCLRVVAAAEVFG